MYDAANWLLEYQNFLQHCLNLLPNYFDNPELFSDLYLSKFLDTSAKKSFFP